MGCPRAGCLTTWVFRGATPDRGWVVCPNPVVVLACLCLAQLLHLYSSCPGQSRQMNSFGLYVYFGLNCFFSPRSRSQRSDLNAPLAIISNIDSLDKIWKVQKVLVYYRSYSYAGIQYKLNEQIRVWLFRPFVGTKTFVEILCFFILPLLIAEPDFHPYPLPHNSC